MDVNSPTWSYETVLGCYAEFERLLCVWHTPWNLSGLFVPHGSAWTMAWPNVFASILRPYRVIHRGDDGLGQGGVESGTKGEGGR